MKNYKKGFTLAEVLITLGILGVIVAITLPIMVSNYKKKQTVTVLKSTYSILSQVVLRSVLENGDSKYWNTKLSSKAYYETYLKKYLVFINSEVNNTNISKLVTYKALNGRFVDDSMKEEITSSYFGVLANGAFVFVSAESNATPTIMVDVNGLKNPNKIGIDLFHFIIKDNLVLPWGIEGTKNNNPSVIDTFGSLYDRDKLMDAQYRFACNKSTLGRWCTALIMADGWEIRADYPWSLK